ncbi:MAG: hypothetical protein LBM93_16110 [Oscillospiraceae bacterium]|nr:hypothetical protein [Oscillospiraceae bacterium]
MSKKTKQKRNIYSNVMDKPMEIVNGQKSNLDPDGSYTGIPTDGSTFPTQDVDDL